MPKRLVLLRGLPGSGKTTLGRDLVAKNKDGNGILLTTTEYFQQGAVTLQVENLDKAQRWNVKRVESTMKEGQYDFIVVDDVHAQVWEMLPYVRMAVKYDYEVEMTQPQNSWSQNGVLCYGLTKAPRIFSQEQVIEMAQRWDHSVISSDQLISLVKPVSPRKDLTISTETPVSTPPVFHTPEVLTPVPEITSQQLVSPLSLFELSYIAFVNYYPAEDVDYILSNLFMSEAENGEQAVQEKEQTLIKLNFPSTLHSQLSHFFTGGEESEVQVADEKQEIQCDVPLELAWQLFCCMSQGHLVEQVVHEGRDEFQEKLPLFLRSDSREQKPTNLREIMEEQLTHNWLFERKLSSLGLNHTTFRERFRLSLQLLSEKFTSLDQQSIEEIFLENQCNFNVAYATLCLLTSEQPSSLTKEEQAIVADERKPSFAFAAISAQKSSSNGSTKSSPTPAPKPSLKLDPIIVVRKGGSVNDGNSDRPQLKYDEKRFYSELPHSTDFLEENSDARNEALSLRQHKKELLEMARKLHGRGLHTAASYYSNQVRDLAPRLAECEEAAALEAMQRRNINVVMQNFIDLHGLKVREALKTLDMLIDRKLKSPNCQSRYLYAITGSGKHSEEGRARLRPAVIHYLRHSRKLDFSLPHSSVVKIDLTSSPSVQNPSIITGQFTNNN